MSSVRPGSIASSMASARGSANTVAASSNEMPCLRTLLAALRGSQANRTVLSVTLLLPKATHANRAVSPRRGTSTANKRCKARVRSHFLILGKAERAYRLLGWCVATGTSSRDFMKIDEGSSAVRLVRRCALVAIASLLVSVTQTRATEPSPKGSETCAPRDPTCAIDPTTGRRVNPVRVAAMHRDRCAGGDAEACAKLGLMFSLGAGVEKDVYEAVNLAKKGCDGGSAMGCLVLGSLYLDGEGVKRDEARGAALLQLACEGDAPPGCTNLGQLYRNGQGVERDPERGAAFIRRGCNAGDARGCTTLGVLLYKGAGIKQDLVEAAKMFERACDGDQPDGCYFLGMALASGQGGPLDLPGARKAFGRACDLKMQDGCTALDSLPR